MTFIPPTLGLTALMCGLPDRDARQSIVASDAINMETLGAHGRRLMQAAVKTREVLQSDEVLEMTRRIVAKTGAMSDNAIISRLDNIVLLRRARPYMARYLLCDPELNRMAQNERIDGWGHLIEPEYLQQPLKERLQYIKLNHGMLSSETATRTQWACSDSDDLPDLSFSERFDVFDTADAAKALLQQDPQEDPTSLFGDKRG